MDEPETTTAEINGFPARILRPLGDTRPARRLLLVEAPALLLWGEQDRLMPLGHVQRFAGRRGGPNETRVIRGAAHLAEFDQPDEVARAVLDWTD